LNTNQIARMASLAGEPARTAMLIELMGGRALTATELARAAAIGASTASAHLAQLIDAQLLRVTASGRHRYYRLASPEIARLIETLMQLAAQAASTPAPRLVVGPKDAALRAARTCYDHLAGRLGVALAQRLVTDGGLILEEEHGRLTERGRRALAELGIGLAPGAGPKSRTDPASCRPCLDWSERRFHIAGRLASHICHCCLERGWLRRRVGSRAVDVTPTGQQALQPWLGLELWAEAALV
jgi:DNA-binding transcriptional ArsR family regulator